MFDPSKLDLDLENTEENNSKKEEIKKTETNDILSDLNNSVSEKLEDNSVLKNFNNPLIKKEEKNIDENNKLKNNNLVEEKKEIEQEGEIGRTEYEKAIIEKAQIEENNKKKLETDNNEAPKIIFDINITSVDILLAILVDKEYDFATFEPLDIDSAVKITFRKDKIIKETRYIKYPIFSDLLIGAKALTNLTLNETKSEQEGSGEKVIRNKNFKILTKVKPGELGSKLFIKASYIEKKLVKKETKKTSLSQIITFLSAIAFIALVIGGGFIGFIVLNAKTIDDVKFFYSLGINLNDINAFISKSVTIIFSILIFIETVFLIIYLFKLLLTKKEFKQKRIRYGIISTIILIVTFSTASGWMIIDKKIKSLPNWQEEVRGAVQLFDNSKLLSDSFDVQGSFLKDTSNLIGPVEIKFNLEIFQKKEEQKQLKIKKYTWDFGDGIKKETNIPTIIHNFNQKGNSKISLTVEEVDLQGKVINKIVDSIPDVNISYVVDINEKKLNNGGKMVDFNASSLKELGKTEWYFMDNLDKPVWTGERFRIGKPIFKETLVGMYIKRNDKKSDKLDKIFIISGDDKVNLTGEIKYTRGIVNDLDYEIKLVNLKNDFGNGYIEEYKRIIGDKTITKKGDVTNPEKSSIINFTFKTYGEHKISVTLKDSAGETKTLTTTIDVKKNLRLSKSLRISNNGNVINNVKYDPGLNEYYINEIGIPTHIKLDARFIKANNLLYTLKSVKWDYNSDGDIDESNKVGNYDINKEGNHIITVYYEFAHRKIPDNIIKLKEKIYIEGIKKEAIIDFKINKKSDYVPVVVGFDASTSQVKNQNIEKFIWDYGDGIVEDKDSIVEGHKYTIPGNYKVKVTVVTSNGKEFTHTKNLILKPKPQSVKITTSMKSAPIGQGIDFSSEDSQGQIVGYFWDFGDGEISTDANPTHIYKKEGKYPVTLKLDFSNKNILEDKMNIEITK